MKITFDIDCTPEEARKFLGLPDIEAMQKAMMAELEERMRDNIRSLDTEALLKTWMPTATQNWGDMQKMFWSQMGMKPPSQAGGETKNTTDSPSDEPSPEKGEP